MIAHISEIVISKGRRDVIPEHVKNLADSMSEVGLLSPITIDKSQALIAGLHRLEAAKLLGWVEIECTVSSLEGLLAELAEVDENVVRKDLSTMEFNELLLRRKEIYEALHPRTRHGGDRKSEKIKSAKCTLDSELSFVKDTAGKLGVDPSTVRRQIQTAKNLTTEAKDIIRDTGTKITKTDALKLSRLDPKQQKEAAKLLATGQIHSMKEYTSTPADPPEDVPASDVQAEQLRETREAPELNEDPYPLEQSDADPISETGRFMTFAENVADLKNPNKDCRCTPDTFVAEFSAYVQNFTRGIEWYITPDYSVVFPALSRDQINYLRKLINSACDKVHSIFHQIEGSTKEE